MAKDPVCGMAVEETPNALKAEVRGVTYYFCSENCRTEFLTPEREYHTLRILLLVSVLATVPVLLLTYLSLLSPAGSRYLMFLLETPLQFGVGWRFYRGAYEGLRMKAGNMDVLVSLGTTAAWAYSTAVTFAGNTQPSPAVYFDSAAVIITLVLAGRYLEHLTKERASEAVRKLMELQPQVAHLVTDGSVAEVPVEKVAPGDMVRVMPGERVPADGIVVEGTSSVDASAMTGESIPVQVAKGDPLMAGTINQTGYLLMKAAKVGRDTNLAQIVRLVESAQAGRAPVQRYADRLATYFVPAVVVVAVLAASYWYFVGGIGPGLSLLAFISVVIVACPCALGIATPAALFVGTSRGAQDGILVKDGESLERAATLDTVVFDKTGTLTEGHPSLTDVVALNGASRRDVLRLAASLEAGSEHPLGRAILDGALRAGLRPLPVSDARAIPGKGVEGTVGGERVSVGSKEILVAEEDKRAELDGLLAALEDQGKTTAVVYKNGVAGLLGVADQVRASAKPGVDALKRMGVDVVMITGDNERTARAIARTLGIDRFEWAVLPEQKELELERLQASGRTVAMVGDGINDAPALARADLGMAMGGGTDIAAEAGGVVLMRDDIQGVPATIRLSRKTLSKIRQNLFWAFFYNAALIPIAAGALVPLVGSGIFTVLPFLAAAAMAVSSATVVGNSLSLFRYDPWSQVP